MDLYMTETWRWPKASYSALSTDCAVRPRRDAVSRSIRTFEDRPAFCWSELTSSNSGSRIAEHARPNRDSFAWRCGAALIRKSIASKYHLTPDSEKSMRPRLLRLTVQYVAEADPLRGCLLELYAH